ncbi:MAG: methylated-DNA--[protein]-cysteine S-methyltransferase [Chloroflexota bacterium]|nr:methylated-DNA--[protein]-cysteine S-methyltransferase [Chloroflexota bacterium]
MIEARSPDARYTAVRTTGIFCRSGCPARAPLARNVELFSAPAAALSAGYRPCLRCRPAPIVVTAELTTPLGPMLAGATDEGICLLEFTDRRMLPTQRAIVARRFGATLVAGHHPLLHRLQDELDAYFAGTLRKFTTEIVARGSALDERVWTELLGIPYGQTVSYQELAHRVDRPGAHRAVGSANGRNRIAILIPCHRVIEKGGGPGGYGGKIWRKERLLALERALAA